MGFIKVFKKPQYLKKKFYNQKASLKITNQFLISAAMLFLMLFLSPSVAASIVINSHTPPQESHDVFYYSANTVISGAEHIFIKKAEQIIYITPGTQIYGERAINNAIVVAIVNDTKAESDSNENEIASVQERSFDKKESKREQLLNDRGDAVNAKVLATFFTSSQEEQSLRFEKFKAFQIVGSGSYHVSNFANKLSEIDAIIPIQTYELPLEKIEGTVKKLQFYKLNSLSLRGPPQPLV